MNAAPSDRQPGRQVAQQVLDGRALRDPQRPDQGVGIRPRYLGEFGDTLHIYSFREIHQNLHSG